MIAQALSRSCGFRLWSLLGQYTDAVLGELEIEITDPGPPPVPQPPEVFSLNTTGRTDPYVIPETFEAFVYDLDVTFTVFLTRSRMSFRPSIRIASSGCTTTATDTTVHPWGGAEAFDEAQDEHCEWECCTD